MVNPLLVPLRILPLLSAVLQCEVCGKLQSDSGRILQDSNPAARFSHSE